MPITLTAEQEAFIVREGINFDTWFRLHTSLDAHLKQLNGGRPIDHDGRGKLNPSDKRLCEIQKTERGAKHGR